MGLPKNGTEGTNNNNKKCHWPSGGGELVPGLSSKICLKGPSFANLHKSCQGSVGQLKILYWLNVVTMFGVESGLFITMFNT